MLIFFFFRQAKLSSVFTNQAPSQGSSSASTVEWKTLNVFMKSLMPVDRGLSVTDDSLKVYYITDKYDKNNEEVVLKDGRGNHVFTIRRKVNKILFFFEICIT